MRQVLVISKEPMFMNEDAELLLRAGLNIAEAPNPQRAQRVLEKDAFDVVIIDDQLLDLDMYKLCQKLRADHQTSVVLIGAKPASDIQGDFKELGVDEYFEKPVNIKNIIKKISGSANLDQIERQLNSERAAKETAKLEQQRQEQLKLEKERIEKDIQEKVNLEKEKLERGQSERLNQMQFEKDRLEQELQKHLRDREQLEQDHLEQQRISRLQLEQFELERQGQDQVRLEKENLERDLQQLKLEKDRLEQENIAKEQQYRIKMEQDAAVKEKQEEVILEKNRLEQELQQLRRQREQMEQERIEQERQSSLKMEQINLEKEKQLQIAQEKDFLEQQLQQIKLEKELIEQERKNWLQLQQEKATTEKLRNEQNVQEKIGMTNPDIPEKNSLEQINLTKERLEKELLQIKQEKERLERERIEQIKIEKEKIEKELQQMRSERDRMEQSRVEKEKPIQAQPQVQPTPYAASPAKSSAWEIISTPSPAASDTPKVSLTSQPVGEKPKETNSIITSTDEFAIGEKLSFNIWDDGRVAKLIDALVNDKVTEIKPIIDFSYKTGFSYPEIDALVETNEEETVKVLNQLVDNKILIKKPFEKLYVAPDGNLQLVPVERCPRCDSGRLTKGQLIEHFYCGYVALDRDFKVDYKYECPKCHRDLRLIGTDYRNLGMHYRCQDCDEVFATPVIKWRSLKNNQIWTLEELREIWVDSYYLNPDKKDWLEFQLKPKAQLIDFLKSRGYNVDEMAQISGSSGAIHTLDIFAKRDDKLMEINLGIGILVAPEQDQEVGLEALFKYDSRAYDVGINYKVIIAIPKLNSEAQKFADRQSISVLEARSLSTLVSDLLKQPLRQLPLPSLPINILVARKEELNVQYSPKINARKQLAEFLRKRGYEVFETVKVTGKSGADHIFDIFAQKNDGILVPRIIIRIVTTSEGKIIATDEVSQFDAEAFDTGIRNKAFVALPQLSVQGLQFAKQQKIKVFQAPDMPNF
jgi:DNA-binding response OmpR family regulator